MACACQQQDRKAATKYQAPANVIVRGSERTEANTRGSPAPATGRKHPQRSGANFQSITASKAAATPAGRNCSIAW